MNITLKFMMSAILCIGLPLAAFGQGFSSNRNYTIYAPTQEMTDAILGQCDRACIAWHKKWRPELLKSIISPTGDLLYTQERPVMIHLKISPENKKEAFFFPLTSPRSHYAHISIIKPSQKDLEDEKDSLFHELYHNFNANYWGYFNKEEHINIPRLIDEGIATQVDPPSRAKKRLEWIKYIINTNQEIPTIETLLQKKKINVNEDWLFYIYANYFIKFLESKSLTNIDNAVKMDGFIRILMKGDNFEEAIKIYGYKNKTVFNADYRKFLAQEARK